jgi:hypothetical protein
MFGGPSLPVVPTVTVLGMIKTRLIAAKKGHQLLKKKARCAKRSWTLAALGPQVSPVKRPPV